MPSCSHSSALNRGEQCLQPLLVPCASTKQRAPGTAQVSRVRVQDLDILLNPNKLSSQSPSQGGTHHVGHIRRGSTLQQSLDDGQVSHEGSHMQGGQARL